MRVALVVFLDLPFGAVTALSQTNDEGLANLQFNYLNPGARSLGMAGAFTGMADDATTALANPAGLVNLLSSEASVELASTRFENEILWAEGTVRWDEVNGVRHNYSYNYMPASFPSVVNNVSFMSYVQPIKPTRLVLAAFYNEQSRFERSFSTKGFLKEGGDPVVFVPTRSSLSMSIRELGLSVGIHASSRLNLGGTITSSRLRIQSRAERYGRFPNTVSLSSDSGRVSLRLGALMKFGEHLSLGVTWTQRPSYRLTSTYTTAPDGVYGPSQHYFETPDSLAIGISYRPNEALAVNADMIRVFYSQLMDGYFYAYYRLGIDPGKYATRYLTTLEVKDRTEIRLGTEYLRQVHGLPVAFRGGIWREPYHGMVRTVEDATIVEEIYETSPYFSRRLRKDFTHVALGAGVVFTRFAVDAAYDYSSSYRRFVLSSVVYLSTR